MNNNYNGQMPPQQPGYQQPMYGQPVYPQQKKSNVGLIVGLVVGIPIVLAIIIAVVVPLFNSMGKSTVGKWECTGTSTNADIEINADNTFELTIKNSYASSTMKGKSKLLGSGTTSTKKKDGYSYKKYKIVDAKVSGATNSNITESDNLGFIFGVDGNGNGHYIDSESVTALEYTCKKK